MSKLLLGSAGAVIGIVVIAQVAYFFTDIRAKKQASTLITAVATVQSIERTVLARGVLEPVKLVSVGARTSGQVMKLYVKIGDTVKAGQRIVDFDSQSQRDALNIAKAEQETLKARRLALQANLRQAELLLTRQHNSPRLDVTSSLDAYDAIMSARNGLETEVACLDAQIRQAGAAVQIARTNLRHTRIAAPVSGVLLAVDTEEGSTVNVNQSAPTIVKLADLSVMKVKAAISEADVTQVKPGQKVYFTVRSKPEKRYHARLQSIEPAPVSIVSRTGPSVAGATGQSLAARATAYYNALFEVPNPDGELRPMMTAQVRIVLDEARDGVTIPLTALGDRTSDGARTVLVVDDKGTATARRVQLGLSNGAWVQIVSGLRPGERVVIGDAANGLVLSRLRPGPFRFNFQHYHCCRHGPRREMTRREPTRSPQRGAHV